MKNTFLSQRFYREAVLALLLGCSLLPAQASPIQADDMEVDTALLAPQAQHTVMPLAHEAPEQAQVHQRYTAEEIAQATAFPFENVLKKRDFSLFNTTEQAFSKGFKAAKILADVAFDQGHQQTRLINLFRMAKFLTLNEFSSLSADKSAVASVAEAMYRRVNTFRLKGNKQNTYDISERETAHAALYYGALIVKRHFSREGYDRAQMLDSAWEKLNYFASMRRYTGHLQLLMVDMLVNEHYRPRISNRPDLRIDDETANSLAQELLAETEKNTHNKENQIRVPQNHGVTRKRGMGDHVPQFMGNLQKVRASLLGEAFEQQRDLEKAAAEHTSTNAELDTNPAIAPLEAATKPQAAVRKRKRVIYEDDDEHPSSTASTTSEAISPPKRAKLTDNATPSSAIVENSDDDMDLDEDDIHEESSSSSSGAPEQKQKVILTPAMKERIEQIYKQQKQNKKVNFIDIALIIEREFHIKIKKSTINNYIAININKNQAQRIHFDNETINATREMAQTFLDNNEKINLGHIAKIVFPEFHCDTARKYVSTILENLGIRKKIKYLKLSDEQKLQIDRLHHEEKKITEICLELNINERKIRNYLKYKKTIS